MQPYPSELPAPIALDPSNLPGAFFFWVLRMSSTIAVPECEPFAPATRATSCWSIGREGARSIRAGAFTLLNSRLLTKVEMLSVRIS